jgi:hypothetical protein
VHGTSKGAMPLLRASQQEETLVSFVAGLGNAVRGVDTDAVDEFLNL